MLTIHVDHNNYISLQCAHVYIGWTGWLRRVLGADAVQAIPGTRRFARNVTHRGWGRSQPRGVHHSCCSGSSCSWRIAVEREESKRERESVCVWERVKMGWIFFCQVSNNSYILFERIFGHGEVWSETFDFKTKITARTHYPFRHTSLCFLFSDDDCEIEKVQKASKNSKLH
jgi:hypothetical protein